MDVNMFHRDTTRAVITAFVFADTWNETRAVLEREAEILFSPLAETVLNEEIARCQVPSDDPDAPNLENAYTFHLDLIRRCKEVGIDVALGEVEQRLQQSPDLQIIDVLQNWFNASTDREKRCYLEHHPALLEAHALRAIDRCITAAQAELQAYKANLEALYRQAEADHPPANALEQERTLCKQIAIWIRTIHTFHEYQSIIHEIKTRVNTAEAIREVAVNHWGGFALDVPLWLEEVEGQDEQFNQMANADEKAPAWINLWLDALNHARSELGTPAVILAEMHARLFRACFAMRGEQKPACLEIGLDALQQALVGYPREHFPQQWAMIQMNLGALYWSRVGGSRSDNLETALSHYQNALQVFTVQADPVRYASLQHHLGIVYSDRLAGDHGENLEESVICFRNALEIRTREEMPEEYAMSQDALGTLLLKRRRGIRRTNLEMSLACHIQALRVYTLEEHPIFYAVTLLNLGNTYQERLDGDKQTNIEQALVCYQEALKVYTPERFPLDYALVQNNIGNAYSERLEGDRRANLHTALTCYQVARARRDREQFPLDHRDTLLNIASLALHQFLPFAQQEEDDHLREQALQLADEAFRDARTVQTEVDWLEHRPLGIALSRGVHYSTREMYTQHAFCLLLRQRPQEALVALEAGRAQALAKEQALAGASVEAVCADHAHEFERARKQWQDALTVGEPNAVQEAREQCLQIRQAVRRHCHPAFLPGDIAYETLCGATAHGHTLVYLAATNQGGFALILRPNHKDPDVLWLPQFTWKAIDDLIVHVDANGFIVSGYAMALERRAIHHLLRWTYYGTDPDQREDRQRLSLEELVPLIEAPFTSLKQALHRVVQAWKEECALLESEVITAQHPLARMLKGYLTTPLSALLQEEEAVRELATDLNWYLHVIELDHLLDQLSGLGMSELRAGLDTLGLASDHTQIALIPCGKLGILPLHAVPVRKADAGETPAFFETCELTYQASTRSFIEVLQASRVLRKGGVFAVGNPTIVPKSRQPSLPLAQKEAEAIVEIARQACRAPARAYTGEKATLTRIRKEIGEPRWVGAWVHAACHGAANPFNPEHCYLLLAHQDRLTLAELQRRRLLAGIRGFVASGCVTGLGDFHRAPDELGNFASGLLLAGVACAVVTLWSVSDRAMCLLMLQFYHALLDAPGASPARALRQAAHWLRTASRATLTQFANEHGISADMLWLASDHRDVLRGVFPNEPESLRPSAPVCRIGRDQAEEKPFAEPIFWAASIVFGC